MPVTIESAGDHAFDLGHIRREGGETLVELLLDRAGLDTDLSWRVQVQKKLLCNAETPPVRVVSAPKKWAVYLKIKPGDNNSCHFCSLLMPDGMQGPEVYESVKEVERDFDRNWKHKAFARPAVLQPVAAVVANGDGTPAAADTDERGEDVTEDRADERPVPEPLFAPSAAAAPPGPAEKDEPADEAPGKSSPRGWVSDPEKTRRILRAIHEINSGGFILSLDHFVQTLCDKLGWAPASRYEVGGVFTSLVRKDLIIRLVRGSKPIGYELSDDGWKLIKDIVNVPPPPKAAAAPAAPAVDPVYAIRSFGPVARQFLQAQERLDQSAAREDELTTELELLRQEREEICRLLEDQKVQSLIERLYQARPQK